VNNSEQPRKILYIIPTADLYGVSKIVLETLAHLPRDLYEPIVILPDSGPLEKKLSYLQVEYHIIPITVIRRGLSRGIALIRLLFSLLPTTLRLAAFIRSKRIRLVHTQSTLILSGAFAAKLLGIPHIWHIHEIVSEEFPIMWRLYHHLIKSLSVRIICISNITARQFPDQSKVRVIPDGINLGQYGPQAQTENPDLLGTRKKEMVYIGMVGRISPRKGHSFLLDAYYLLTQQHKDHHSHLFIIGDIFSGYEYYLQELQAKVKELNLSDNVTFAGFIENMLRVYPLLDIVVVPSELPEGLGLVVLEAMASNIPVVATCIGGPAEIIEQNISGLLIPPDDPQMLAEALANLCAHPDERKRLGEGGYQRVKQAYNIDETIKRTLATYQEIK
jgi:glycosyltransferase involved in cell wall biosynthesis